MCMENHAFRKIIIKKRVIPRGAKTHSGVFCFSTQATTVITILEELLTNQTSVLLSSLRDITLNKQCCQRW